MDFTKITITNHILEQRIDRINAIKAAGGIGVAVRWLESKYEEYIVHIMTSTNVILVIDKYTSTCLTLYQANKQQLYVFNKYGHTF